MCKRSKNLFERIPGYRKAQPLLKESFDYSDELSRMNIVDRFIFKSYFLLSGFNKFNKSLPQQFEYLANKYDMKGGALYTPVISFSASLLKDKKDISPIQRAATLVIGAISLKNDLLSASLPQDTYKDIPLEMGQYPNLFGTSQIIDGKRARIYKSEYKDIITIVINGIYYILDLTTTDNEEYYQSITNYIKLIVEDSNKIKNNNYLSPGIITAASNPVQLRIFDNLSKDNNNKLALETIRKSLFTLCLDLNAKPSSYEEVAKTTHSENLYNRWFHSSLQLVIYGNSQAGIIINFSANISGNNMMRAASEIYRRSSNLDFNKVAKSSIIKPNQIRKLEWKVSHDVIERATKSVNKVKDFQNDQSSFTISKIGKKDFGNFESKAVPIFILALENAAKLFINQHAKITQFVTTSKYCCSDLNRVSVTTMEVIEFIDFINQDGFESNQAFRLLNSAIDSQLNIIKIKRTKFPIYEQIALFTSSKSGISKFFLVFLNLTRLIFLWVSGYISSNQTEIVVSHPKIFDEVPVIGRPGIRVPYAKYFGLHYQIFDDKIKITLMPGVNWDIENKELVKEIEKSLYKIKNIINNN